MGCLNSQGQFEHWFGNIHLSGPCNRSCYFCIGQHMMALDSFNVLDTWPLPRLEDFVAECWAKKVHEIYVTGTNTDPLLYSHTQKLRRFLERRIKNLTLGVRTNGALILPRLNVWELYDKASITICSFNPEINDRMMGSGRTPRLDKILRFSEGKDLKVNIVLGPENASGDDIFDTLDILRAHGIKRVNLREPYGQPHVGDPLSGQGIFQGNILGMPSYNWDGLEVVYWDVHFVEVESVNYYANGTVSLTYPISKGHAPSGEVHPQAHFPTSGRHREQWLKTQKGETLELGKR